LHGLGLGVQLRELLLRYLSRILSIKTAVHAIAWLRALPVIVARHGGRPAAIQILRKVGRRLVIVVARHLLLCGRFRWMLLLLGAFNFAAND
jgi:hypothetical protein